MKHIILLCVLLLCILAAFVLSGCDAGSTDSSDSSDSVSYAQHSDVREDVTVLVKTDPVTTQTEKIEVEYVNQTNRDITFFENAVSLEKKVNDGFVFYAYYGNGQEVLLLVPANGTSHGSISVGSLEAGTYRFVFFQGTEDKGNYISSEFQVVE